MASEEHRLTDPLNNAENDSESEIQETLARQTEASETLSTNSPSAQLKENVEANAAATVPNGMISSPSSSFQGETSNDIKEFSESSADDYPKEPSSAPEEVLANVSLKDNDAPEDAQKKLPMEVSSDSFMVQDQVRKMGRGDEVLIPTEEYLLGQNVFQTSEAVENVSVINNIDCSDKDFISSTFATNEEQSSDLVIDVTSEKPILEPKDNSNLEEISSENVSVQSSVEEQVTSDISDLERFLLCSDIKISSDSVQFKTNKLPSDDLLFNVISSENFRNGVSSEKSEEEITQRKSSCLSNLQDSVCKSIDIFAQSSEGGKLTQTLEQSPIKSISCTDTLLNFCKNINISEPGISLNSKNDLKSITSVHSESNGSIPVPGGIKEQCITTALTCEKPRPTISLITDEFDTLKKEPCSHFSDILNTMGFMIENTSDEHASGSISDVSNILNLKGEECSDLPTAANISVLASKDVNTAPVFESEELVGMFLPEVEESGIKPPLEFQDLEPINLMHNNDFNFQFVTSSELKETTEEIKIPSNVPLLDNSVYEFKNEIVAESVYEIKNEIVAESVHEIKNEIVAEKSEFPDDTVNESQRLQVAAEALPSIVEKDQEEESKFEEIFDEIEFNLQNSPMLRRSRQSPDDKVRRDCRFIFEDDSPCENHNNGSDVNQKPFVTLRDSLDIAKLASCLGDTEITKSVAIEDSVKVTLIDDGSACFEKIPTTSPSVSNEVKSSPPHYQSSKVLSRKKKTSIKTEKERENNRRVSFPEDDSRLITSYLEPVNPWYHMSDVSTDVIADAYRNSCKRHKTRVLPDVLQQIVALPVDVGGRIECLNVRNHKLEAVQCESLEEIFRRVQFHTLDFENCELDDESAIPLFDMMEFYDSAIHLNISHNNKIGNRGWQACARMLKRTPSLRILEAKNTNLSEQNMPIICKALRLGTHLHTLHLENCNLTGRPLVSLAGALRLNDTVTDLYLADNRLGGNDCIQLGNLVRSNKVLKLLDLRNNNVQDPGCGHICKDIAEQQNSQRNKENAQSSVRVGLTTLVLWNNHITVQGVQYISLMLHSNYTLETLNLGRNNLTSEGLLLLKTSLLRNRNLRRIGLQATRIGNEGAVALAECIADNQTLSRIDLRENSIQVAGLLALSRSLKINTTVIQLDLDANPRAEPTTDLSDQHLTLYHEIKNLCQCNLTNDHLRREIEKAEETKVENPLLLSPDKRKISLTCETTKFSEDKSQESSSVAITVSSESKKYRSPDPSPSVSPCPSPSLSPSPSPVPSPLKNRFKVCKVPEVASGTSYVTGGAVLSTSAPAFLMHNPMSGSLPSLVSTGKPNRFSSGGGGRFTVTKVTESNASFKSSLPCNRAMSSPSLIVLPEPHDTDVAAAPTIVVSSPNKAVRGFNIKEGEKCDGRDLQRNASLDLPISVTSSSSPSSDSSSPQDDVFLEDEGGETAIAPKVSNKDQRNTSNLPRSKKELPENGIAFTQTCVSLPEIQKAPLASIEGGSVDSDSEDSDLMTQSSDSTRSDEVRISVEESTPPLPAWGGDKRETNNTTSAIPTPTATTSTTSSFSAASEVPIIHQPHPSKKEATDD